MREKELRIALVCFGGVSLAVYMHGISKEILKLVRASSALHAIHDRGARLDARFSTGRAVPDAEFDTEDAYFELLREIGKTVDLRVVVDIIAGASAGGINGTMLARALAHDLPMGALRDLWLDDADVTELLAAEARAKRWSKWFIHPIIWTFAAIRLLREINEPEVRQKLSLFVRSRWFKPPFDGVRMSQLMYDAITSMGAPADPARSLLPAGQQLELFVALTDYYGYQQPIEIHDPPVIEEREHRHVLRFNYRRWPNGDIETDFALANAPALAFAARATSSFPGAFPPAQIVEVEHMLARRGITWPTRQQFIDSNFAAHTKARLDPLATSFIDGSVLNNKPFREAIQAIRGRPAYRQVDRRLVYIDPDPRQPHPPATGVVPGFFVTLKGALSDIPRNEPIAEELSFLARFNERVRRLKTIVEAARPQITRLVADIIGPAGDEPVNVDQIKLWREAANNHAVKDAGFAYEGYVRLKLAAVRMLVSQMIAHALHRTPNPQQSRAIADIVDAWASAQGIVYGQHAAPLSETVSPPRWVGFLLTFDIDFRRRRLDFLIQGQNRLYEMLDQYGGGSTTAGAIDRLKRAFYGSVDRLRHCDQGDTITAPTRTLANDIFGSLPDQPNSADADVFATRHAGQICALIDHLGTDIGLANSTHELDILMAGMDPELWPAAARREVLVNYLGFPFWDVLTLSITNWRDAGEFDEILVDRISPDDTATLSRLSLPTELKGTGFGHFAAFFSRSYRENDYLLGRLHAVDRLIDIVCNAAGLAAVSGKIDVEALKCRAFQLVLDAEERHLPSCADLIARLRRDIAGLSSA